MFEFEDIWHDDAEFQWMAATLFGWFDRGLHYIVGSGRILKVYVHVNNK